MKEYSAIQVKKIYTGKLEPGIEDGILVWSQGRIEAVLRPEEAGALAQYGISEPVIARNQYMVPGLIDAHVHMMLPGDGTAGEDIAQLTSCEIEVIAVENARKALRKGVVVLRDCGSLAEVTLALKRALEAGRMLGPELVVCGSPLTSTGGHIHYMGGEVDGPEEVRKRIRQQKKAGADFTKIIATGGGTKGVFPKCENLTREEIRTAVEESRRLGMHATAHVNTLEGIKIVLDAGIDGMEHGYFSAKSGEVAYDPRVAEQILEHNIVVCETIQVIEPTIRYLRGKESRTIAEEQQLTKHLLFQDRLREMHRLMIRDGVSFIAGSDAGWRHCQFGDVWEGLQMLSECGMKADQLLHMATAKAADHLGIGQRTGSLAAGLEANFLLVEGDPMADISNLARVHSVYRCGQRV